MNKVTKKILTLLMAVTLVVGMFTTTYANETKKINVTFAIERFTIGQGFLVEPVTVQVNEGAAAKDVLEEVAKEKNSHVTKYHCLNVNSCSPVSWDVVHSTIIDSTWVVPRAEYRFDCFK